MNRLYCLPLFALCLAGCGGDPADSCPCEKDASAPLNEQAGRFDPAAAGRISGKVAWSRPIPYVPPVWYDVPRPDGGIGVISRMAPNPNRPRIVAGSRGIGEAVVYLRGVDPATARPWPYPPVSVEIGETALPRPAAWGVGGTAGGVGWQLSWDRGITVVQGARRSWAGFVRRGDSVALVSTEPAFHIVRGRGADFFSMTLPEPDQPVSRALKKPGRVELSSGSGLAWMRADLFVFDHPYITLTDAQGRFELDQVPAGRYELVVWLPNWDSGQPVREPESTLIVRQTYAPAYERVIPVTVETGKTASADAMLP